MKKLIGGMIVALGTMCVWVHGYTKGFTQCRTTWSAHQLRTGWGLLKSALQNKK